MERNNKTELYNLIKKLGVETEEKLNQMIHQKLSSKRAIEMTNTGIQKHTNELKQLKEYHEILAQQYNIPTKDDIARIAKLVIQIEEKIDLLEKKISKLSSEIHRPKKNGKRSNKLVAFEDIAQRRKTSG
jgi:peptidoglycan hydrolase CwlO-like protein